MARRGACLHEQSCERLRERAVREERSTERRAHDLRANQQQRRATLVGAGRGANGPLCATNDGESRKDGSASWSRTCSD